jgi:hypothetical protein
VGDGNRVVRKRATGTREQVVAYLTEIRELFDKDGMASTRLAAAVGYPGSSVAFAQLLSGMERSGVIKREVRGKRTYRITLGDVEGFGPTPRSGAAGSGAAGSGAAGSGAAGAGTAGSAGPGPADGQEFDYDELARRLLVHVVRALATESSLREQLREAQQSIALAREQVQRLPVTADLDESEVMVLQQLLSPGH